jgi:hypothetical protein
MNSAAWDDSLTAPKVERVSGAGQAGTRGSAPPQSTLSACQCGRRSRCVEEVRLPGWTLRRGNGHRRADITEPRIEEPALER